MAFKSPTSIHQHLDIVIQFKPNVSSGLLLYVASYLSERTADFLAIELYENYVNLRYNTGTPETTVIRSNNTIDNNIGMYLMEKTCVDLQKITILVKAYYNSVLGIY